MSAPLLREHSPAPRHGIDAPVRPRHPAPMSTLAEIETAADALTEQEKEELFLFLATRLRSAQTAELPPPRKVSREQMEAWIHDDEEGMRSFREGR